MRRYLDLLQKIRDRGIRKPDRTGTGTLSLFGEQLRLDLRHGFPAVTTKKLHLPAVVHELLWFLRGDTNVAYLRDNGVRIWDEWADENGELGPVYGAQWRSWRGIDQMGMDQIAGVVRSLREDPHSRRHVVSAWNVAELHLMALHPCHILFQFYVGRREQLSCQVYQRSADVFLGLPFNIASYALLTHVIAQCARLEVGELVFCLGDAHLYLNHLRQADEQLSREPLPLPEVRLNPARVSPDAFRFEDIRFEDYESYSAIPAPISV